MQTTDPVPRDTPAPPQPALVERTLRVLALADRAATDGAQPRALARRIAAEARRVGPGPLGALLDRVERGDADALQSLRALLTVKYSRMWREPAHWPILAEHLRLRFATDAPVRIWSAACAHGEEAFTIAMVAAEVAESLPGRRCDWRILATDLDSTALAAAREGVVQDAALGDLPQRLHARHLARAGDAWRVDPALLAHIDFARFDLTEPRWPEPPGAPFDAIFLANVLIYFDRAVQASVLANAAACLTRDGILLTARAEGGLAAADGRLKACGPCAYILAPGARSH